MLKKRHNKLVIFPLVAVMILMMTAYFDATANIAYATTMATYFVDPTNGSDTNNGTSTTTAFKTIEKAQRTVRGINSSMTGDIYVYLRGGTYTLHGALEFSEADSGTNGYKVIYRNYSTETPIISGGETITGWTNLGNNVYRTTVSPANDFRQLYVNGTRKPRAFTASGIPGTVSKQSYGYLTDDSSVANWGASTSNPSKVEIVYHDSDFTRKRLLVDHVTNNGNGTYSIYMATPYWTSVNTLWPFVNPSNVSYVENSYAFLDTAGEWYLDKSTNYLYYKAASGENVGSETFTAPLLTSLLEVRGMLNNRAQNLEFNGITFSYATYLKPNITGHMDFQANMDLPDNPPDDTFMATYYLNAPDPSNITVEAAKNVSFKNCTLSHLGSGGITLSYTQGCTVSHCTICDVSGNGVNVLGYPYEPALDNPDKLSLDNCIDNNSIHDIAVEYSGGVGIFVGYTRNTAVAYNEVYNVPYTGISVGWGWGMSSYTYNDISRDNKIVGNNVHDSMLSLADGGALYTLGAQPNSCVYNNYFSCNGSFLGIYFDQGSMNWAGFNNVCENVADYAGANCSGAGAVNDVTNDYLFNNYSNTPTFVDNGSIPAGTNFEGAITGYTLPYRDNTANTIKNATGPSSSVYTPTTSDDWKMYDDNTTRFSRSPYVIPDFNKITYYGTWYHEFLSSGVLNGTIHYSNTANDYATFKFYGTQVRYYSPKSSNYGTAYLSIDNGSESSVNLYSANWVDSACLLTISGLSSGEHTLKIRVGAGNGYVPVDSISIYNSADTYTSTKYYNDDIIGCPSNNNQIYYSNDANGTQWYEENGYSMGTIHYANAANAYATFRFTGTQVSWYSPKSSNYGTAYVSIDNGTEYPVSLYSANWVDSASRYTFSNLSNGVHTIKVRVSGDGFVPVDGFAVTYPGYASPTSVNDSVTGTGYNQFSYTGTWYNENNASASGGTVRYSATAGDIVTLKFKGTQIKWFGTRSTNYGIGAVSILRASDNSIIVPETAIDPYTNTASVIYNQLLWSSPVLPNGDYILQIRVTGAKNPSSSEPYVLVDGVQVIQ